MLPLQVVWQWLWWAPSSPSWSSLSSLLKSLIQDQKLNVPPVSHKKQAELFKKGRGLKVTRECLSNHCVTFALTLNVPSPKKLLLTDWFAQGYPRTETFRVQLVAPAAEWTSHDSTNNEPTPGLIGVKWRKQEIFSPCASKKGEHARLLSCQCKVRTETLFLEKALRQKQIFFFFWQMPDCGLGTIR